ncbi:MAG: thiamine diphosphokinase [Catonella sp.]|uniref:thiamine diphosphokinase n=1 Tax=Catonella sp. TaxID=2382125 RepID=UPI003FA1078A
MKKVLIITGGQTDIAFAEEVYKEYRPNLVITADSGLLTANKLGIIPDYAVGDFDSSDKETVENIKAKFEIYGKPIIKKFNPEKDETDTEIAISLSLSLNPAEIVILGATGTRLDHTMANIGLLYKIMQSGIKARIMDKHNVISLHDKDIVLKKDESFGEYFSLLPFTEEVRGLKIKGAKYELDGYILKAGSSLGISNEIVENNVFISFEKGILLIYQTSDVGLALSGKM